jgi:hypothetical protein
MRRFEECQVQDVGGAMSANTYGYVTSTCMFWNMRESKLILIPSTFLQEASISRNRTKNQIVAQVSIKRKVGYSDDEVAEARKRMSRMRLD